ncbi:hypothetical protein [Candidatus Sodalis pierantonius]|uniref:hypothetical protein n=1 Tax=Candidatus Sodalis pierantonii TaxID=1486991 RepID=UPI0011DD8D12|nr:hypothetical protein [Candidatus Sodalis pierantonius]
MIERQVGHTPSCVTSFAVQREIQRPHSTAIDAPMPCLIPKPKKNLILPVASVVPEDKKLYSKSDNFQ